VLKSSVFWKAFFVVWLGYSAFVLYLSFAEGDAFTRANAILVTLLLIGTAGMFGLALARPVGPHLFWKIFFFVQLAIVAVPLVGIGLLVAQQGTAAVREILIGQERYFPVLFPVMLLVQVVYMYGLYRYAFKSDQVWRKR
jgi:hypothetical protein